MIQPTIIFYARLDFDLSSKKNTKVCYYKGVGRLSTYE